MELTPGYKQTELGVLPDDWDVDRLERFWSVVDCKHVTAKFVGNGYPVASIMEVQARFVDLRNANFTTASFYNTLIEGGRRPRVGDLILSRNATVGEVAQVAECHPAFAMGQDVCLLRKRSSAFCSDYLQLLFGFRFVREQFSELMVGSTFKRVNVKQVRNLTVAMPSPREQYTIAAALSDADALIESLDQTLSKKRQIKQGAMQQLLTGEQRLPGFRGTWEKRRMASLGSTFGGLSGKSKHDFGHGTGRYISFMNVISNVTIDTSSLGRVEVKRGESQNEVARGDLFFNGSSETPDEVGMCALLDEDVRGVFLNSFCFGFRPKTGLSLNRRFLVYLFRSGVGREYLKSLAQGAIRYNLSKTALLKLDIALPELPEQNAIVEMLSDMDDEISALERKVAKARTFKQGMAQQLLTGRIRLVDAKLAEDLQLVQSA